MIDKINQVFEEDIKALSWVERYGGMTRPLTVDTTDGKTVTGKKTHPVACMISEEQCLLNQRFYDMAPDSSKKSMVYWEIKSDINAEKYVIGQFEFGNAVLFSASVRLVAWINLQKLGITGCFASSAPIMELMEILRKGHARPHNILKLEFQPNTVITNQKKIFEGYTYEERQGLMMYPYYAFAITGNLLWAEDYGCLDTEWTSDPIECLDLKN